jgi:hypothetical protein
VHSSGVVLYLPEIADFEARRPLIHLGYSQSIRLDVLGQLLN